MGFVMNQIRRSLRVSLGSMRPIIGLTIVCTLLVVGGVLQTGATTNLKAIRARLGNDVLLLVNYHTLANRVLPPANGHKLQSVQQERPITNEMADKLGSSQYVISQDRSTGGSFSSNLEPILPGGDVQGVRQSITRISVKIADLTPGIFWAMGNITPQFRREFTQGQFKLSQGRFYNQNEVAKGLPVAVVHADLAKKNHLVLGSGFTLWAPGSHQHIRMKVIGIYQESTRGGLAGFQGLPTEIGNILILPYTTVQKALASQYGRADHLDYAVFYLEGPDHIEAFRQEAVQKGLDLNKYTLDAHDDDYAALSRPFRLLSQIVTMGLIILFVIGILFVTLCEFAISTERELEYGTYRSLGVSRHKIAAAIIAVNLSRSVVILGLLTGIGVLLLFAGIAGSLQQITPVHQMAIQILHIFWSAERVQRIGVILREIFSILGRDRVGMAHDSLDLVGGAVVALVVYSSLLPAVLSLRTDPRKLMLGKARGGVTSESTDAGTR